MCDAAGFVLAALSFDGIGHRSTCKGVMISLDADIPFSINWVRNP
jgi:hypothetical protein